MPLLGPGNYLTHFLLQDKQRFGELCMENFLLLFTPHNLTPFSWKNDIKMSSFFHGSRCLRISSIFHQKIGNSWTENLASQKNKGKNGAKKQEAWVDGIVLFQGGCFFKINLKFSSSIFFKRVSKQVIGRFFCQPQQWNHNTLALFKKVSCSSNVSFLFLSQHGIEVGVFVVTEWLDLPAACIRNRCLPLSLTCFTLRTKICKTKVGLFSVKWGITV